MNPYNLLDKTILITGASSGIGRAIAIESSKLGAKLILVGRDAAKIEGTLNLLSGIDHQKHIIDLTDIELLSELVDKLPKLDGIVLCAGTVETCPAKYVEKTLVDKIFSINTFSPIFLIQKILGAKRINKNASIVFISSITGGLVAQNGNSIYGCSKAAISSFSKVLALELSPRKIRVNAISPGMVRTDLLKKVSVDEEQFAIDELKYPLGYGEPNDVAFATIYLLSDISKWVTGSNLIIDGGFTLQ